MKIKFLKSISPLACLFLSGLAVNAESTPMKVHVPFEFVAGDKMLPAGDYVIDESVSPAVLIHGSSAEESVGLVAIRDADGPQITKPSLKFERRGGLVFLSSIETPEKTVHLRLPSSIDSARLSRLYDSRAIHH